MFNSVSANTGIKVAFKTLLSLAIIAFALSNVSYSAVYKWVDENGQIHYGDKRQLPTNAETERLEIKTNTPEPKPEPETDNKESSEEGEKKTEPPKDDPLSPPEPQEAPVSATEKNKLCAQARSDLSVIQSRGQVRERDAQGNIVYLGEDQRQQRIAAAKRRVSKYCR